MKRCFIATLTVFALALAGCGRQEAQTVAKDAAIKKITEKAMEKAIEKDTGGKAKVNLQDGKMAVKTKDGEINIAGEGGAAIPADFPKDVLVYKGTKVVMSMKEKGTFLLSLETTDDAKKVSAAIKESAKKQGWSEETSMEMGEVTNLVFAKESEKRKWAASIAGEKGKTQITVNVTKEQ